jgi:hypothetical protein
MRPVPNGTHLTENAATLAIRPTAFVNGARSTALLSADLTTTVRPHCRADCSSVLTLVWQWWRAITVWVVQPLCNKCTYVVAGLDCDSGIASKPTDKPKNCLKESLSPLDQKNRSVNDVHTKRIVKDIIGSVNNKYFVAQISNGGSRGSIAGKPTWSCWWTK